MSKIQLKDICCFSKGSQINGDELIDNGEYDYLNGGINPSGKWSDFNVSGDTITISEGGNSCGYVNYIYKLNHNLPLSQFDYDELERILTQELGDSDDYKREYGDTPFGLLIRKITKLDHESTMRKVLKRS